LNGLLLALLLAQFSEGETISANPDAAVTEAAWQWGLRAKAGVSIPFIDDGSKPRFRMSLPFFLELHNALGDSSWVPFEYWRARVQLEARFDFPLSPFIISTWARLEHESDHPTASIPTNDQGWVHFNSISGGGALHWEHEAHSVNVMLVPRLHLLSCTRDPRVCGAGGGTTGDRALEFSAGATYQWLFHQSETLTFDLFASLWGTWIFPSDQIVTERRLVVRAGIGLARPRMGRAYIFLSGFFGTQVGYARNGPDVALFGCGFGWTM
jgi:hypothetical protein